MLIWVCVPMPQNIMYNILENASFDKTIFRISVYYCINTARYICIRVDTSLFFVQVIVYRVIKVI